MIKYIGNINNIIYKDMETLLNKAKRVNKWVNLKVIQQYYDFQYGWEDVEVLDIKTCAKQLLKDYRLLGYNTRVIYRRVLNPLYGPNK